MRLYVMRHGPAEDRAATGRDFDRALTGAGRQVVERAARLLSASSSSPLTAPAALASPPRVITSPFRRAHQTAEVVAALLGAPEPEPHDDLGADAGVPHDLVRAVRATGADTLLVGHQPFVEALVRGLVEPAPVRLPAGFRTAIIVAIEAHGEAWRVSAVIDPHA